MAARKNAGVGKKGTKEAGGLKRHASTRASEEAAAPVVSSERRHTTIPSETTPAGVMTEATARAAAAAAPVRPAHEEIARRAYELWCAEGRPDGRECEHWFAAERSLIVEMKPGVGTHVRR